MECLRSAKFSVSFSESFVFGAQTFALRICPEGIVVDIDLNSKFKIEGFKNVDVYGIKFIPRTNMTDLSYYSSGDPSTFVIQNNYEVSIFLEGDKELLGGSNVLAGVVTQSSRDYLLNNFANEVTLLSPLQSCKSIDFGSFRAIYGLTYANSLAAAGHNFIISVKADLYLYYKYEGE